MALCQIQPVPFKSVLYCLVHFLLLFSSKILTSNRWLARTSTNIPWGPVGMGTGLWWLWENWGLPSSRISAKEYFEVAVYCHLLPITLGEKSSWSGIHPRRSQARWWGRTSGSWFSRNSTFLFDCFNRQSKRFSSSPLTSRLPHLQSVSCPVKLWSSSSSGLRFFGEFSSPQALDLGSFQLLWHQVVSIIEALKCRAHPVSLLCAFHKVSLPWCAHRLLTTSSMYSILLVCTSLKYMYFTFSCSSWTFIIFVTKSLWYVSILGSCCRSRYTSLAFIVLMTESSMCWRSYLTTLRRLVPVSGYQLATAFVPRWGASLFEQNSLFDDIELWWNCPGLYLFRDSTSPQQQLLWASWYTWRHRPSDSNEFHRQLAGLCPSRDFI